MSTARSTPNIALIKYWGNRNDALRLPAGDSLSITLNQPFVDVTVDFADSLTVTSFFEDAEKILEPRDITRFKNYVSLVKKYMGEDVLPKSLSFVVRSHIPPRIGIASSAAVFSAAALAIAELVKSKRQLSKKEISVLARLGSGSAARSIFGGFTALTAGKGKDIDAAAAEQIADETHWNLHDIIIVPSYDEKKVGSTEGHALAATSPLFSQRLRDLPQRFADCRDAILTKDFEKLQHVSEEDCLDMHNVMRTSMPSLQYLSDETHRIVREITQLRESENVNVLYTMDAGPTVHLICTDDAKQTVLDFAQLQKNCSVYETQIGAGAHLV